MGEYYLKHIDNKVLREDEIRRIYRHGIEAMAQKIIDGSSRQVIDGKPQLVITEYKIIKYADELTRGGSNVNKHNIGLE